MTAVSRNSSLPSLSLCCQVSTRLAVGRGCYLCPGAAAATAVQVQLRVPPEDVIQTKNQEDRAPANVHVPGLVRGRTQQADGTWSPWRWWRILTYRGANLALTGFHTAGIRPDGFFQVYETPGGEVTPAIRGHRSKPRNGSSLSPGGVMWHGNRAPRLSRSCRRNPRRGPLLCSWPALRTRTRVTPSFGPSGSFESAVTPPFAPDFKQCTFDPPGGTDPVSNFPYQCPWVGADDNGSGVSHTYTQPGTWGVLVMTEDSHGAVTRQQFNVVIQNLAPTLTIVTPPAVTETQPVKPWRTSTSRTSQWLHLRPDDPGSGLGRRRGDQARVPMRLRRRPIGFRLPARLHYRKPVYLRRWSKRGPVGVRPVSRLRLCERPACSGANKGLRRNQLRRPQSDRIRPCQRQQRDADLRGGVCMPAADPVRHAVYRGRSADDPDGLPAHHPGRIVDAPDARHFVKVLWGDGTSSAMTPGCADPGCPGTVPPWLNGSTAEGKVLRLAHTYQAIGDYPITIEVDDGGPSGTTSYQTQASIYGISPITGPAVVAAGEPITFAFTSKAPSGLTPALTPTCEGGELLST